MITRARWFAFIVVAAALCACSAQQQNQAQRSLNELASSAPAAAKDAYLATAVAARLTAIDADAATAVHVSAQRGVVTLTGEARTVKERGQYGAAARSIGGVAALVDRLHVNPRLRGTGQALSDAALTARVTAAIAEQAGANVFHVKTSVRDGHVKLNGTVPSFPVKQTILDTVRHISGVRSVVDAIAVHP